ncbi:probable proteasome subunit beta type-2 [Scaptodrosophila lebanonensis]|uniref:Proteasome subunit beta n=1 Tax=Drosophila lebanonensis TaxID=7225 RepID=A0A6J2TEU9_DROLE|nr:probable proteasome subunit beta type-2 [Scaptodrosophila lebanonensis]
METVLGIKGCDFVMLGSDTIQIKSVVIVKSDHVKIYRLNDFNMMALTGDTGNCMQFADYVKRHVKLYHVQNGYAMEPLLVDKFTRSSLGDYIRTNMNFKVSTLLAGYDQKTGPNLQFIDQFGSSQSINHAGHGLGSLFCSSIFAQYWHDKLKVPEAYEILKKCVTQMDKRFLLNVKNFDVYMVDKNGIRRLEAINSKTLKSPASLFAEKSVFPPTTARK